MAAAIPAAIGAGSSIIGGISGKGAAKEQRKLAERMLAMNQPFLQNQLNVSNMAVDAISRNLNPLLTALVQGGEDSDALAQILISEYGPLMADAQAKEADLYGTGRNILNSSLGYLGDAAAGLRDVQNFYRPFMYGGARAIDQFLPTGQRTWENIAPEVGAINEGAQATTNQIEQFTGRGGGRATTSGQVAIAKNKQISDAFFKSRQSTQDKGLSAALAAAQGQTANANSLANLFQSGVQGGLGTIGAGLQYLTQKGGLAQNSVNLGLGAKNQALNNRQVLSGVLQALTGATNQAGSSIPSLFNTQSQRAAQASNTGASGLGGYLVDLFSNKSVQDKVGDVFGSIFGGGKKNSMFLTEPYNPYGNQTSDFDFTIT